MKRRLERMGCLEVLVRDSDWVRLTEGVACHPEARDLLSDEVGGLIFDIDGVLIDTHRSFREVIPQAVNFYLEVILKEDGAAPLMRAQDVGSYKACGGFNNDWDVAEAGLMHALWWSRSPESAPSLQALTGMASERGGGLEGIRAVLREVSGERVSEQVLEDVDRITLVRIFKELYVGGARFREVFGEEPRFYKGTGGMEREKPLVEGTRWEAARRHPLAVLTGRVPQETRLALSVLGLSDLIPRDWLVNDDGRFPTKPDPTGLIHIARSMQSRPLFYFGDTRDDLTTLRRARDEMQDPDLHFVCCLSGSSGEDSVGWFASRGSSFIAVEVMDALSVLPL